MGGSKGTKVQWEDQKERKYNERIKRKKEQWEDQKERKKE